MIFCSLDELTTESDVEQKLIWPLLTTSSPNGSGFFSADVVTKLSIRRLEIGKGASRKLYYPDYMVVLAGLPVMVVEAKAPSESAEQGLAEARLYASELNSLFASNINPCIRIVSCNGSDLLSAPADTAEPDIRLTHGDISPGSTLFERFVSACCRSSLQKHADQIRRLLRKPNYRRAVSLVGGSAFQDEELPPNTFGSTILSDYGHVFNPRTREERLGVVREAYVPSLRRQRYIEPIDRLIRNALLPSASRLPALADSGEPSELYSALRERRSLEGQVLLLVGSVGSGKSTFIDYISLVALPEEIRSKSIWARINLNDAPLSPTVAYAWIAKALANELKAASPDEDVDDIKTLVKVFKPEITALQRGALSLLDQQSTEYKTRLVDAILAMQGDHVNFAKCLARYVCAGSGKLLIIVLDNCDKRTRDEQLIMFQVAHWVRTEFKCLVVLPLRDVTFDRHRSEPPLDTAIKGLTFRIEPPPFIDVLQARVRLALKEMDLREKSASKLAYFLPNGIKVSYPAADQSLYLASILRSLYAHDRFVRQIMTGLAGRDVRRALEIFLDFCTSGHIGEDDIYKIRYFEGKHVLPLSVVARVLLRMNRRFYSGDHAYVKNLVQCSPEDALPDHFVRLAILHWLERRNTRIGPAGVQGFHRIEDLLRDLAQLGHDGTRVRAELLYLVREGCIVAEHQRLDEVIDGDLVRITASGLVHLQLMANPEYLAACAEDTYVSDMELAARVHERITSRGLAGQFSRTTPARNALELVEYLKARAAEKVAAPDIYLADSDAIELRTLREAEAAVGATEVEMSARIYVGNLAPGTKSEELAVAFERAQLPMRTIVSPPRPSSNSNRWFAFVDMKDGRTAMEAIDSLDLILAGRKLVINEAHSLSAQTDSSRNNRAPSVDITERLYVAGLPHGATETSVKVLFQNHALHPIEVYLPRDRETGIVKGFGFVAMSSEADAAQAIGALNGSLVDGSLLIVKPAKPRANG